MDTGKILGIAAIGAAAYFLISAQPVSAETQVVGGSGGSPAGESFAVPASGETAVFNFDAPTLQPLSFATQEPDSTYYEKKTSRSGQETLTKKIYSPRSTERGAPLTGANLAGVTALNVASQPYRTKKESKATNDGYYNFNTGQRDIPKTASAPTKKESSGQTYAQRAAAANKALGREKYKIR